ncbi:MAG: FmdB family zinc ribbon protein [Saccharospirillum sp.]
MPTYSYRGVESGEVFSISQSMNDAALEQHPDTGEAIVRIIKSAPALHMKGLKKHVQVNYKSPAATACGCASNVALAQQMYANSRETPKFGSVQSKKTVHGGLVTGSSGGHSHGHSHGGSCGHNHGSGGSCGHKH